MTEQRLRELVHLASSHDLNRQRPRSGACYLDFLDHWLSDAIRHRHPDDAYKYAREIGHIYLQHSPQYAPIPHNVVLGEN